jgi:sulfite reductase alpha subunit-like flavoprotein
MVLYFGCRHKERDFIYQENLESFKKDGVLFELNVTFSRDESENGMKYVQVLVLVYLF